MHESISGISAVITTPSDPRIPRVLWLCVSTYFTTQRISEVGNLGAFVPFHLVFLFVHRLDAQQPPLNLAPSLFILVLSVARDATYETTDSSAHTSERTSNTSNYISFPKLGDAITESARDAANGVVCTFAYIAYYTANGTAYCATKACEPVTYRVAYPFSYSCDGVA